MAFQHSLDVCGPAPRSLQVEDKKQCHRRSTFPGKLWGALIRNRRFECEGTDQDNAAGYSRASPETSCLVLDAETKQFTRITLRSKQRTGQQDITDDCRTCTNHGEKSFCCASTSDLLEVGTLYTWLRLRKDDCQSPCGLSYKWKDRLQYRAGEIYACIVQPRMSYKGIQIYGVVAQKFPVNFDMVNSVNVGLMVDKSHHS